jgi:hypothetical protein
MADGTRVRGATFSRDNDRGDDQMMLRVLATAGALGMLSGAAFAQATGTPVPPQGPTQVECDQGYQQGSRWSAQEFTAACAKLREGREN